AKVKYVLLDGLKLEVKPEDPARAKAKGGGGFRGRAGGRGAAAEKAPPEDEGEAPASETKKESPRRPDGVKDAADQPPAAATAKKVEAPPKGATAATARMKKDLSKAEEKKVASKADEPKKDEAPKPEAPPFVDVASELDEDRK